MRHAIATPVMRRVLTILALTTALMLLMASTPMTQEADAHVRRHRTTLWDVRRANSQYWNVAAAERAGYSGDILPDCFSSDKGGMGVHWINEKLLTDDKVTPLHPEALVYELGRNGRHRLVAVEYVVPPSDKYPAPSDANPDGTPPTLFGQTFTMHPTLGVWKLHAWLWRWNPTGVFADYNPRVKRCPAG